MKKLDITGNRYGRLVAISFDCNKEYKSGRKVRKWLCRCDCGNYKSIPIGDLRNGKVKSCGCLAKERATVANLQYGLSNKEKLYGVWQSLKKRCYNKHLKAYKYYGGRGISVCEEWKNSYPAFREWAYNNGYQEIILPNGKNKLTIDRINNDGNYEPNNCRWVDMAIQNKNKRHNQIKELKGEKNGTRN